MIAYLSGLIRAKADRHLVLDVNGVGYKIFATTGLVEKTELNSPLSLLIHTVVREEEISLYGFETQDELNLFELLISVNGVGPKTALEIFSWPTEKVQAAILSSNTAALTQIKGIGKKTAERIVLELKEKVQFKGGPDELSSLATSKDSDLPTDVEDALLSLGYRRQDMIRVFRSLKTPLESHEAMIKYFLKNV
ncbi:MAG: Holliday junction branch migration protein RuvA [Candidatus Gracilibacteria bacterium]|jgi:Holliday junction DNA helicase RuvA